MNDQLASLEPLTHRQRVKRAIADFSAQSPPGSGFYERQLALYAAAGRREEERVREFALSDPSPRLRARAVKTLAYCGGDESVLEVVDRLSPQLKMRFLRALHKRNRYGVIDCWLNQRETPPVEALAYGSVALLDRHLTLLLDFGTTIEWCRLTRRHPEWVLQNFLRGEMDEQAQTRASLVIHTLCKMRSPFAWPAWREASSSGLILTHHLEDRVFSVCFREMTRFALEAIPDDSGTKLVSAPRWDFGRIAHQLDISVVEKLLIRGWLTLSFRWWKRFHYRERVRLWNLGKSGQTAADGTIAVHWLSRLPRQERIQEAQRQISIGAIDIDPGRLCSYLGLLDWSEADERLAPFISSPEPSERAAGLAALTKLAHFNRERLGHVLEELKRRNNEPDPVRCAFLTALSEISFRHFSRPHLPILSEILSDLRSAADASIGSFRAAEKLILRLFSSYSEWATEELRLLLRHTGNSYSNDWLRPLELDGIAAEVDLALESLLSEWCRHERYSPVFGLARQLGPHLKKMPRMQNLLSRLCRHTQPNVASEAFAPLYWSVPYLQRDLVPQLVTEDLSWVSQYGISQWLHRHRQDLLTPLLRGEPVRGKFASGKSGWVLKLERGFWRWTPTQQAVYSKFLSRLVEDRERDFWTQRYCLQALALLPDVEPITLKNSAALSEDRQAIRDEALRCLARVEDAKGLPLLLEALDDERSRIAVYSLRRLLLEGPPEQALSTLGSINTGKITVRKEVLRLLGDLPDGLGLPVLLERLPLETHRDTRLAIYRGLWAHLEEESARVALLEAADSPDEAVGRALAQIPSDRLGKRGREFLNALLLKLLSHPSRRVRFAVLKRLSHFPLGSMSEALSMACCEALELEPEGAVAAEALLKLGRREPGRWDAALAFALPKRRQLQRLVDTLRNQAYPILTRHFYQSLLEITDRRLSDDPSLALLRLELAASASDTEVFLSQFEELWHTSRTAAALPLAWKRLLTYHTYRLDRANLAEITRRWGESGDEMLRRLTFDAFCLHVDQFGWNDESRAALVRFQQDGSLIIRAVAQFVYPPPA